MTFTGNFCYRESLSALYWSQDWTLESLDALQSEDLNYTHKVVRSDLPSDTIFVGLALQTTQLFFGLFLKLNGRTTTSFYFSHFL